LEELEEMVYRGYDGEMSDVVSAIVKDMFPTFKGLTMRTDV
jgi:hypothetical protein